MKFEGWCDSEVLQSAISVEVGDREPCNSKYIRAIDALEPTEVPENDHVGIRAFPQKMVVGSTTQLKCLCTNSPSMGNRQEALEAIVQWENYDVVAITEIW